MSTAEEMRKKRVEKKKKEQTEIEIEIRRIEIISSIDRTIEAMSDYVITRAIDEIDYDFIVTHFVKRGFKVWRSETMFGCDHMVQINIDY